MNGVIKFICMLATVVLLVYSFITVTPVVFAGLGGIFTSGLLLFYRGKPRLSSHEKAVNRRKNIKLIK